MTIDQSAATIFVRDVKIHNRPIHHNQQCRSDGPEVLLNQAIVRFTIRFTFNNTG